MSRSFLVDSLILKKPSAQPASPSSPQSAFSAQSAAAVAAHQHLHSLAGHGVCLPRTPADVLGMCCSLCVPPAALHPSVSSAMQHLPLIKPSITSGAHSALTSSHSPLSIPHRPTVTLATSGAFLPRNEAASTAAAAAAAAVFRPFDHRNYDPRRFRFMNLGKCCAIVLVKLFEMSYNSIVDVLI